ncbi:MAG: hypothetical protein ACTTKL_06820 [Treponema sp.]
MSGEVWCSQVEIIAVGFYLLCCSERRRARYGRKCRPQDLNELDAVGKDFCRAERHPCRVRLRERCA